MFNFELIFLSFLFEAIGALCVQASLLKVLEKIMRINWDQLHAKQIPYPSIEGTPQFKSLLDFELFVLHIQRPFTIGKFFLQHPSTLHLRTKNP